MCSSDYLVDCGIEENIKLILRNRIHIKFSTRNFISRVVISKIGGWFRFLEEG